MINASTVNLELFCEDNKRILPPVSYIIQVWIGGQGENAGGRLVRNITVENVPHFIIRDLNPATVYFIKLYAVTSAGGNSQHVWIQATTGDLPKISSSKSKYHHNSILLYSNIFCYLSSFKAKPENSKPIVTKK